MINELLKLILFFFIKIIPKNKKILVFGDRAGLRFADNSRHLFFYLNKNHREFRCIWITKNKKIFDLLNQLNYEVYLSNSIKGIFYCLIAKWHLFNFVEDDIHKVITTFSNSILLWHGVLPKKLNTIKQKTNLINDFIYKRTKKYFVYPNEKLAKNILERFPKYKYELLKSNLPRNININTREHTILTTSENNLIERILDSKKKIFGYFPTWRSDGLEIFRDVENFSDFKNLDKILIENNSIILLKKHMNSEKKDGDRRYNPKIEDMIENLKVRESFLFADYDIDLNSILNYCDFLITDYSGVVFDYLYLDIPIIFYTPDYEDFKVKNGFTINVIDKNIGIQVNNISQLVSTIIKLSKNANEKNEITKNKLKLKNEVFIKNDNGLHKIIDIINEKNS